MKKFTINLLKFIFVCSCIMLTLMFVFKIPFDLEYWRIFIGMPMLMVLYKMLNAIHLFGDNTNSTKNDNEV